MEGIDFIPDFLSGEVIAFMALERVWSKIRAWLEQRSLDKRLDDMSDELSYLKGKIEK